MTAPLGLRSRLWKPRHLAPYESDNGPIHHRRRCCGPSHRGKSSPNCWPSMLKPAVELRAPAPAAQIRPTALSVIREFCLDGSAITVPPTGSDAPDADIQRGGNENPIWL